MNIIFIWIPGHNNIEVSKKVDHKAKKATE